MRRHEIKTYDLAEIARDKFPAILSMVHQDLMMDAIRAKLDDAQIMQLIYTINNYGRVTPPASWTRRWASTARMIATSPIWTSPPSRPDV